MDLITGKGRVILKFADAWIGKPRRHSALNYGVGDRLRQRLNLLIRFQGHRTYFASSMTTLTVAFENRQDVAVKRGSSDRVCREVRACGLRIADGGRGCEEREGGNKRGNRLRDGVHSQNSLIPRPDCVDRPV